MIDSDYQKMLEQCKITNKKYREKHEEEIKESSKQYNQKYKKEIAEYHKARQENIFTRTVDGNQMME